jgi:nicotinamide riboside kinase
MRVACSGVHGSGKTTLVEALAKQFDLKIIPEQARHLLSSKYSFDLVISDFKIFMDFQFEILYNQLALERDAGDNYIVDRPFIDSYIYVKERFIRERCNDLPLFSAYRNLAFTSMLEANYSHILFVRPFSYQISDDGIRETDPIYILSLDNWLEYEYLKYPYPYYEINTDNFKERLTLADNILKGETTHGLCNSDTFIQTSRNFKQENFITFKI